MKKPLVAIIGRPNVGKSTFFNKIIGKRVSIVDDKAGVTRDRIYGEAEWTGHYFNLIDTGGLDYSKVENFQIDIQKQAQIAIDLADVIIFLVDGKEGVTISDEEVATVLRKTNKPIVLCVNKLDNFEIEKTYDFYTLGIGEPFPITCSQSKGLGDVLDKIVSYFPKNENEEFEVLKIAVVGRPNVGKSSIINKILGEERVIVSDNAGTTRDAIDTPFRWNKKDFLLIDTAGLRRQRAYENNSIEGYSVLRSFDAIERADVVLIVFDSSEEITEQDVRIAGYVHEAGKPNVIVMNKWDLVEKNNDTASKYKKNLAEKLSFMDYFLPIFISAKTGQRVGEIMQSVDKVYANASKRISTGVLNEMLSNAVINMEPPYRNGKKIKISYITQSSVKPPTFILFANEDNCLHFSYLRYLENFFRKSTDLTGTPIKIIVKGKKEKQW